MHGAINIIDKKKVVGWVMAHNESAPVSVNLFINGEKKAHQQADEFRKYLLEKKIHLTGNCGFSFDVEKFKIDPMNDIIEIKADYNIQATNKLVTKIYNQKRSKSLGDGKVIFFVHIPKTAGTSFRNMLYEQFEQDEIYPNIEDIDKNGNRYPKFGLLKNLMIPRLKNLKLFCGHYTYNAGLEIIGKKNIAPIIFFRNPVERTVSLLYQLRRMQPKYVDKSLEYVFDREPNQVTNVQTYYMTGGTPPLKLSKHQLKKALERLEQLDVFGLSEEFDKSVEKVEKQFGWSLGNSQNLNKNPASKKEINKQLLKKIKAANKFDIELYENAAKMF